MYWLFKSSIGRKLVMSISGLFLILFLTFHVCMNLVVLFSPESYNAICEFLGANWYALAGTLVLAAGVLVHILYAFVLYFQNRSARGNDVYAVTAKPKNVEWASQNMLALGITVIAFLVLHAYNFWAKMQLVEILHKAGLHVDEFALSNAANGAYHIAATFADPVFVVLYLVGLGALWFHLTHGFWSAFQTMGITNKIWFNRWKCIGNIYATLVILGFVAVVVIFFIKSLCCCL
jgi:succinate dehydrogenase / fumarate reductase cytochrome b subunit